MAALKNAIKNLPNGTLNRLPAQIAENAPYMEIVLA